ncbi:MAG: ABC transporter substrate-binding protein [Treponema sp.]|jgi:iron complex transport system substrate-binding protein|nr:ABC transporter substrate-binding protein [Treponema sp.]
MGRILCIIGASLLLLGACVKQGQKQVQTREGITFIDDDGNTVTIEQPFRRIIALYSAHTENLFSIGAGDFVIGGHKTCTYPAQADVLPKFDYTGDPEYIIAEAPDLVLIRPFIRRSHPAYIAELEKAGILVVSLYPDSMADFDGYIRVLALLTGKEKEANEKLLAFHDTLQRLSTHTAGVENKQTVFFESTAAENRTVSAASFPAYAIEIVNASNIAANAEPISKGSSIALYGTEKILQNADRIDAYIVQQGAMNRAKTIEDLLKRPGFSTIKALREKRVLFIDEKLISSPTFRYIEGVSQIAAFLYPEVFIP